MNKKLIIGIVVAVVVIAGGVYLYNRNKKPTDKAKNKSTDEKKNLISETDASEMADIMFKKYADFTKEYRKPFIELYISNFDKDSHAKLKSIFSKKDVDWTEQEKLEGQIMKDKVIKPLKDKMKK